MTRARKKPGNLGTQLLVVMLVMVAVLIILLRLAEFSGHRVRRPRPTVAPAVLIP